MIIQGYINIYVDTIRIIRLYVNDKLGNTKKKFNEYERNMPSYIRTYIGIIGNNIRDIVFKSFCDKRYSSSVKQQEWDIISIYDMDELFIPSINVSSSDVVMEQKQQKIGFYDGPFFFLPFCHVYKCIVGIQGDDSIHSVFPHENKELLVHRNEFVAFNYNWDAHYIYKSENNDYEPDYTMVAEEKNCIMLKMHYIIFPKFLPLFIVHFYKFLHIWFNNIKNVYKRL